MGFNDMFESSLDGITSYHFNFAGIARRILGLVVDPGWMAKAGSKSSSRILEIDGMVIDRGSA